MAVCEAKTIEKQAKKSYECESSRMIGLKLKMGRLFAKRLQEQVMIDVFGVDTGQKNRISEIENGKLPNAFMLMRLCSYYGVSADWVLGFSTEMEINRSASIAGIIYNGMYDRMLPMMTEILDNFALVGVKKIESMPNSIVIQLLNHCKKHITSELEKGNDSDEFKQFMAMVRQCDVHMAKTDLELFKELDNITDRDIEDWQEVMQADLLIKAKRRGQSFEEKFLKNQLDIFRDM